jgi:hypothetical protein
MSVEGGGHVVLVDGDGEEYVEEVAGSPRL